MATALFITRTDLVKNTIINGNVDTDKFIQFINIAQDMHIQNFLGTDDGENLVSGYKRATNIVRIEEKKDGLSYDGDVDEALLTEPQEKDLFSKLKDASPKVKASVEAGDFENAMAEIATLRAPIDAFFEAVTVNADEFTVRENRLRILSKIRASLNAIADFSCIEG